MPLDVVLEEKVATPYRKEQSAMMICPVCGGEFNTLSVFEYRENNRPVVVQACDGCFAQKYKELVEKVGTYGPNQVRED